jgi:uncharacterized membrane protein
MRMADDILPARQRAQTAQPAIRRLGLSEVWDALALGAADFRANPLHRIVLTLVYPAIGLILGWLASGAGTLPLLYPIAAGFALIGPFAGVGLYELSRRRERGIPSGWLSTFAVFRSPRIGAIMELGVLLAAVFVLWLVAANSIYDNTLHGNGQDSIAALLHAALATRAGWMLCAVGTGVGFLFAVAVLSLGVISFPLLLDRDLGGSTEEQAATAAVASVAAVIANPLPMALWGLIVAAALMIGVLTAFAALVVVMPILGHTTWHLYRKIVV